MAPLELVSVNVGKIVALLGNEKSAIRLPLAVLALAGNTKNKEEIRALTPVTSLADKVILRNGALVRVWALVSDVLLTLKVLPPAKLPVLLKDIEDLPAPRLPDPPAGAGSSDFLQEDVIDNKANAIITGNENEHFAEPRQQFRG